MPPAFKTEFPFTLSMDKTDTFSIFFTDSEKRISIYPFPFTLEARKIILEKLLKLEIQTGLELITEAELKAIDKMWDEEGDLSCRNLVDTYYKVKGKKLAWDEYKIPRFDAESIAAIESVAKKHDIPVELITKLIVSVDDNKHITKNNKLQKAFDQIVNQGWLHHETIERALDYENKED